ncbi:MAG: hypothetical protein OEY45_06950, partial [Gammaproteobacteria bacterium]|nr:hypothetical protein [Gammaproteobacteria bacterium]
MASNNKTCERNSQPYLLSRLLAGVFVVVMAAPVMAFDYDCMMEPNRVVEVKSTVNGRIEAINVERS